MQAENCNNPELGRKVFQWAMLRSGLEAKPSETDLQDHIVGCPACSALIELWKCKAETGRILAEADRALVGDLRPNECIEERQLVDGRVLFKFSQIDLNTGLLLILGSDGQVSSVSANATRSEFESLRRVGKVGAEG